MVKTATKPQIGLEDKIVTNPDLEALLEDRQLRKAQAKSTGLPTRRQRKRSTP